MIEPEIYICECHSYEHQSIFWYDDEDKQLTVSVHLVRRSFFKRLWYAIKYVFGYKSRFGAWDEFLFKPENEKKLREYLDNKCK